MSALFLARQISLASSGWSDRYLREGCGGRFSFGRHMMMRLRAETRENGNCERFKFRPTSMLYDSIRESTTEIFRHRKRKSLVKRGPGTCGFNQKEIE